MAWSIEIDGVDVSEYVQFGVSMQDGLNERPTARLTLKVRDGDAYTGPVVRKNVDIIDSPEIVFRGIVWTVRESPVIDNLHRQYVVECVGYEALADVTLYNGSVSGGTLESMANMAVANLSVHGIQVDPSQVTGPTLETMGFAFATITKVLGDLAGAAGYNVAWDGDYVRLEDPGTVGAPFDLTESNSTINGLQHTQTLANYINRVWVLFGEAEQREVSDGFTGDGSTKTFALHYFPVVMPGWVTENGTPYSVAPHGTSGSRWYYRASDNAMVVDSGEAAPTNGHIILVPLLAQFPGAYLASDSAGVSANGPWETTIAYPDVYEWSHAAYAANWELDRRKGIVKKVSVKTFTPGLKPGMTVSITATTYGLSATSCLITRVSARHVLQKIDKESLFEYTIEALEGNQWQLNWQEYFKSLVGTSGAGGASSAVTGVVTTTTTVRGAFWGGSRTNYIDEDGWQDVPNWLPVSLDGTNGVPHTVRVGQSTADAGTSVQTRVVRISDSVVVATGATGSTVFPSFSEVLLTFTPTSGANDHKLQVQRGNSNARVYAFGQSL